MALGAATVLAGLRDRFDGQVMFLLEPNEETLDSQQEAGAYRFVREGMLDDPKVDLVLGQHVYPEYPTGQVALRGGVMMTGYEYLDLAIVGHHRAHVHVPQGRRRHRRGGAGRSWPFRRSPAARSTHRSRSSSTSARSTAANGATSWPTGSR